MPRLRLTTRTWRYGLLGLIAVVALVMAAVATVSLSRPSTHDGSTPYPTIDATPGRATAVLLGDEYSTPGSIQAGVQPWTTALAAAADWTEINWSEPGMGYLAKPESCATDPCGNILGLVSAVVAADPSVVVIAAGESDASIDQADLSHALDSVYGALRTGLPHASIVAVGPASVDPIPSASTLAIDGAVRAAATTHGATYVSLLEPPVISTSMVNDKGALDAAGAAAITARVAASVRISA